MFGNKLGHMVTGSQGFKRALFCRFILDNSLGLVIADLFSLLESTTRRSTNLPGFLGTSSDGGVLLDLLFGDSTYLSGPLCALGLGGVSRGFILTLFILDGFTFNNIIFNLMLLLLGPAFRFMLSSTNFWSLNLTVLN